MTVWKKAMSYLGLGPDDAYDDYDLPPEPERAPRSPSRSSGYRRIRTTACGPCPASRAPTRTTDALPRRARRRSVTARPRGQGSAVRPVSGGPPKAPHTVRPLRFDQAQEVADTFKHGQPVIMNLQEVDRDLLRRLIDFASGLCYALNGKLDKVASGVYLLTPANVSDEDRRQMAERDFE